MEKKPANDLAGSKGKKERDDVRKTKLPLGKMKDLREENPNSDKRSLKG